MEKEKEEEEEKEEEKGCSAVQCSDSLQEIHLAKYKQLRLQRAGRQVQTAQVPHVTGGVHCVTGGE
jgi:hypothetical protein